MLFWVGCFYRLHQRRKRLIPIPRDWEESSVERLRLFCLNADQLAGPRRSVQLDVHPDE